jgi:hypothetical protein
MKEQILDELMSSTQLEDYLGQRGVKWKKSTGAKHRWNGGDSPPFRKIGRRVIYVRSEVDNWLLQRLSPPFNSTSAAKDYATREGCAVRDRKVVA